MESRDLSNVSQRLSENASRRTSLREPLKCLSENVSQSGSQCLSENVSQRTSQCLSEDASQSGSRVSQRTSLRESLNFSQRTALKCLSENVSQRTFERSYIYKRPKTPAFHSLVADSQHVHTNRKIAVALPRRYTVA